MILRTRRASVLVAFFLLASAATAHADCAWVDRILKGAKPGDWGTICFYDQVKAYSQGHTVPANDVRALYGVLNLHQNVSKAIITTTALFASRGCWYGIPRDQKRAAPAVGVEKRFRVLAA